MALWSNIGTFLFLIALILLILCIISFFKKNGKAMRYGRPTVICFIISFLISATSTAETKHPIVNFFANVCLILFIFFLVLAILSIIKKTGMAKKQFLITAVLFIAFGLLTSVATPSAEKITAKDKKVATEKKELEDKKDAKKKEADEKAQKQQEEQKRQAEEQASQKKSTVASSATSNHGGSNGQPFQNDPSDDKETNTSCKGQIKGNANSKKYHVPGGQYYDSTKDNIVWFCSEVDAKAAGYVKSKK
ncbi:calcium-binding protein [Bacillus pseudomycoides]|uniref:sunset domain-containing protein n=1 Tax=Bacillus pseudomycoides TaxID=64104 RepID=UPI000BED6EE2|nr:calcium-binding protein [Bacillus pseudomycoides]PDY14648.1 calcium-binding protein [Bacillus pseudomycoides]PEU28586.1 calcium-binding protein [Bacillus pseudomycoides]PGA65891.1 calcium-binding protein [Bacillus pseudomycoides]